MNVSKEDLLRINQGFGGNLRSDSSLDFAIEMQNNEKLGIYKKLAHLMRAILVDHPFSDGNQKNSPVYLRSFLDAPKSRPAKSQINSKEFGFDFGHKRTAAFVALAFANEHKKQVNNDLLLHNIVSIAKQNITNIRNIEWRLKNAII
ncbi:MAG: hypothetical protein Q7S33_04855 [Nanoarchaeota archaeon]|nr:hypothetical protein [Nanoarchaeota archaeon]